MSIEQITEAYMANPDDCPYCKSGLSWANNNCDPGSRTIQTSCRSCGAEFTETFVLSGVAVDVAPRIMPFAFFKAPWAAPLAHGKGDLAGRLLWIDLEHLEGVLTETGLTWFKERVPMANQPGPVRRIWAGFDELPKHKIGNDVSFVYVACSDDGDPCEMWTSNGDASLEDIEEIMEQSTRNTGCTMVVCFNADGTRNTKLDMG